MAIYSETLKVLEKLLQKVQSGFTSMSKGEVMTLNESKILSNLDTGIGGLSALEGNHKVIKAELLPPKIGRAIPVDDNWLPLVYDELYNFNKYGAAYISSCSEALLKSHGIINPFYANNVTRGKIYYRGEHNCGWKLISRLGRKAGAQPIDDYLLNTSAKEIELLRAFQEKVRGATGLKDEVFNSGDILSVEDPGWWAIMQHYDGENGTRMIDLTSSIFCALYFACADWDGSIDCGSHGKLYLFAKSFGRGETNTPDLHRGINIGPDDKRQTSVEDYFTVDDHVDIARFRCSPEPERGKNERLIAQDGFFTWQPKYHEPLNTDVGYFEFYVHKDAKKQILRELYSIGYTAERIVRGEKGKSAHGKICPEIGVPLD